MYPVLVPDFQGAGCRGYHSDSDREEGRLQLKVPAHFTSPARRFIHTTLLYLYHIHTTLQQAPEYYYHVGEFRERPAANAKSMLPPAVQLLDRNRQGYTTRVSSFFMYPPRANMIVTENGLISIDTAG